MTSVVVDAVVQTLRPATVDLSRPLACGAEPELFWPVTETGPSCLQIARAKAMCAGCPQRAACLEHALTAPEPDGIWGGTTAEEREALLRGRRAPARYPARRSA